MNTKLVNIFYNKLKVGRLALEYRKIYFEYDNNFLKSGIELSPYKLPLKSGVFTNSDNIFDGLFGLFSDSLPDGWGRLLMDRHLLRKGIKLSEITALDRLMLIGNYGTGALTYEPVSEIINDNKNMNLDELSRSSLEILKGVSEEDIETLIANNGSSAGARPKIMVQINENNEIISGNQELRDGYEHYMVKFASSTDGINIGKLEYVYSLMAKEAGIEMSDTKLLNGKNNSYFAIKRFDRNKDERIHMHSLCGMVHSDFRMPTLDYDDILRLTFHLSKDMNDVIKVYKLAVFNLLTHNRDDHAKNFSFLLDYENNWKFSPAYDLTFSYGPGGEHSTTYLNVGKNPTRVELEKLGNKHKIKNYKNIIEEIYSVVSQFKRYTKQIEISEQYAEQIFSQFVRV